jgi:hypothetical protein
MRGLVLRLTNWIYIYIYTGCPRRNVPDFGRVFLMLKYTEITQNTYIQSWTVTEIMAREKCGLLAVPRTIPVKLTRFSYTAPVLESRMRSISILLDIHVLCKMLGTLRTSTALVRVFMSFNLMVLCHLYVNYMLSTVINITETTYFCQF